MKNPETVTRLLFFTFFTMLGLGLQGQVWQNSYPGTTTNDAVVVATPDGGFLASSGGETVAFKTDANGQQQWALEMPDSLDWQYGGSVALLPDGNYVVVGGAGINVPYQRYTFCTKVDPAGNVIWQHFYPYGSAGVTGQLVTVAADGGIFISSPYNLLMKTDANGNKLWEHANLGFSIKGLVATADGGVIFLINDATVAVQVMILRKYDANGNYVWEKSYTSAPGWEYVGRGMTPTNDGGFAITGMHYYDDSSSGQFEADLLLQKFDANGDLVWQQLFAAPGTAVGKAVWQTQDGGYAVTGWQGDGRYVWLWRFDALGNLLWDQSYFLGEGLSLQELSDGGFIVLTTGLHLLRTDAQGIVFQHVIKGRIVDDQNADCQFQTGEQGLAGWWVTAQGSFTTGAATDANGYFEIPVDVGTYTVEAGLPTSTWQPCQPTLNAVVTPATDTVDVGEMMMKTVAQTMVTWSGEVFQDLDGDCEQDPGEPLLSNVLVSIRNEGGTFQHFTHSDANGHYEFSVPANEYYGVGLPSTPDNPYCTPCCNDFCNFGYLDASPVFYALGMTCTIPDPVSLNGFVFYDENENCQLDFGEPGIGSSWEIEIVQQGTMDTLHVVTEDPFGNTGGNFGVQVAPGDYYLTILPPNYLYLPCLPVQQVTIGVGGAPTVYIPLMPLAACPKLTVDVGTAVLRPCFPNTYSVHYCNEGTATAEDAYVEVTFPPSLTVQGSSIPSVQLPNNTWQFQLGDIEAGDCGDLWISTFLDCADSVGLTYCVEAHIFPDSICGPTNPVWDGSTVELSANCVGDSVVLAITNAGWGSMSQPLEFIVVEDNVLIRDSTFQLPAGASTTVTVFPNGATIILSAQQAAGHPGMSMPVVFVEGCGADSISLGFVTQYPMGDADCFLAIDCRESVASFDPNIKEAQPKGVTEEHYIENTTDLTYQITFQNLGTAPATTIVVLDTLSAALDPERLELGASSHQYSFELLPPNVVKFTFENIHLPHVGADFEASIGFVKFRTKQRPGNLPGTVINNRAGIYFDFNDPVITNTVTHRIPQPVIAENQEFELCVGEAWNGRTYTADTLLTEWQHFAFFDSVFTTWLDVLPTTEISVDTIVAVGSEVYGVVIVGDTVFTQTEKLNGHCVVRTVTVHLLTDAQPSLSNLQYLGLAPNPTQGDFTLTGHLSKGAFCEAKLMDSYGRTVVQLFKNEWLANGFSRKINLPDVPTGLYFVSFSMDGQRQVIKLLVE